MFLIQYGSRFGQQVQLQEPRNSLATSLSFYLLIWWHTKPTALLLLSLSLSLSLSLLQLSSGKASNDDGNNITMVVILTKDELLFKGLELVGFDRRRQQRVCRATNLRRRRRKFLRYVASKKKTLVGSLQAAQTPYQV